MKNPAREILTEVGGIPEISRSHDELKKYDIDELKLILMVDSKTKRILNRQGGRLPEHERSEKARKLHCNDRRNYNKLLNMDG